MHPNKNKAEKLFVSSAEETAITEVVSEEPAPEPAFPTVGRSLPVDRDGGLVAAELDEPPDDDDAGGAVGAEPVETAPPVDEEPAPPFVPALITPDAVVAVV